MNTFRCPVCRETTNTYSQRFVSDWAVVAHTAGKVKHAWRDREHEAWARSILGDADKSLESAQYQEDIGLANKAHQITNRFCAATS
jgi:hypothetical protein